VTSQEAIEHAARLLHEAELRITNLPLMERLNELAGSWLSIAHLMAEKERV